MTIQNLTIAEAVVSNLIVQGRLDETNPQLIREFAYQAERELGISLLDFYTGVHEYNPNSDAFGTIEDVLYKLDIF